MKSLLKSLLIILLLSGCASNDGISSSDIDNAKDYIVNKINAVQQPQKKPDGSKYRIACVGSDSDYFSGEMLYYLIEELCNTGWIKLDEKLTFNPKEIELGELVTLLSNRNLGDYIEFLKYDNYRLNSANEPKVKEILLEHDKNKDLDLVLCLGAKSGKYTKNLGLNNLPVMLYSCVDPVGIGFSESMENSGKENLWAFIDFPFYSKQLQFYYDNSKFKRLGIIYSDENTSALRAYREIAEKNGFEIFEVQIAPLQNNTETEIKKYNRTLEAACDKLLVREKIDAFLLGIDVFNDFDSKYADLFCNAKVPVLVQGGEQYVQEGALMMLSAGEAKLQAPFVINTMAKIFSGVKPNELRQEYIAPTNLCLNLKTAEKIGFEPSTELIISAKKIYN